MAEPETEIEIEITPEMIEEGASVLDGVRDNLIPSEARYLAEDVFRAMMEVAGWQCRTPNDSHREPD